MKRNRFIQNACGLLLLAVLASCEKNVEYANLIPKDASLVLTTVPADLLSQAEDFGELKQWIDAENNEMIKELLSDPEALGVDYNSSVYLFASLERDEPTLLMKLDNEKALKNWLDATIEKGLSEKVQSRSQFNWAHFPGKGYCVFTKETVMWVYAPMTPVETLLTRWAELMKQSREESFLSTAHYTRMQAMKETVKLYFSFSFVPNASDLLVAMNLPAEASAEDLSILGGLNRKKEKVAFSFHCYSENEEVQKLIDEQAKLMPPLKMDYLKYTSKDAFLTMFGSMNKEIYAEMMKTPNITELTVKGGAMPAILFRLFDTFDGEFVTIVKLQKSMKDFPDIAFYGQVDGSKMNGLLLDIAGDPAEYGIPLTQQGPDKYSIRISHDQALQLGVKEGKEFYLTTGGVTPFTVSANPLDKNSYEGLKGAPTYYYALFNLESDEVQNILSLMGKQSGYMGFLKQVRAIETIVRPGNILELNVYLHTR